MQALIDWVSFTIPENGNWRPHETDAKVSHALTVAALTNIIPYSPTTWKRLGGRAPYNVSWNANGITLFAGKPDTVLIEIAGQGCEALGLSTLRRTLCGFASRVTRIDLAADMLCSTSPATFVEYAVAKHIQSKGHVVSPAGETVYLGSRKSERYARIYRYSAPHPRHMYLRCEMVFRGDYARAVAKFVCENGLEAAIKAYGEVWGWKHPSWSPESLESRPAAKPDMKRSGHKTVRWLIAQAAPAFKKCVQDGVIEDAHEFISQYFMESEE